MRQPDGKMALVVTAHPLHQSLSSSVHAYDLDFGPLIPVTENDLVDSSDACQVPQVGVGHIDLHAPGAPVVFEGCGEDIGRGEEQLPRYAVAQHAVFRCFNLFDDHGLTDLAHEEDGREDHAQDDALGQIMGG